MLAKKGSTEFFRYYSLLCSTEMTQHLDAFPIDTQA